MAKSERDIVAFEDHEHVLKRPALYVGSITKSDEKIPIYKDGYFITELRSISVAYWKIIDEVIDNALDEAKRCAREKKPMDSIFIRFDSNTGVIEVEDTGRGFKDGERKNSKTGLTNIETALTKLRSGSNFYNEENGSTVVGMNGMGVSLCTILSDWLEIETNNGSIIYKQKWVNFTKIEYKEIKKTTKKTKTGTIIRFKPRQNIFVDCLPEYDIVLTKMILRNLLIKNSKDISNLNFHVYFDGKKIDLDVQTIPPDSLHIKGDLGNIWIFKSFEDSCSLGFINGALCTGSHINIIRDNINEIFDSSTAHHFYEMIVIFDLPAQHVRFGDQNKTKFVTPRSEMEEVFSKQIITRVRKEISRWKYFKEIKKLIQEKSDAESLRKVRSAKRQSKVQISDKYTPPAKKQVNLFICEGHSAAGGLCQGRNPQTDGVYALKGKVKNVRTVKDLATNKEVLDLIHIMGLEPGKEDNLKWEKIIIAADADPDGHHISSLIINFIWKWFPNVIRNGKLMILKSPLVRIGQGTKRKYFYSKDEFNKSVKNKKSEDVRYLKGLGSMNSQDWEWVYRNMNLIKIVADKKANKSLQMAMGENAEERKLWLSTSINKDSNG
jgi:DNA gyrase/topoisomerase IV subunit B